MSKKSSTKNILVRKKITKQPAFFGAEEMSGGEATKVSQDSLNSNRCERRRKKNENEKMTRNRDIENN